MERIKTFDIKAEPTARGAKKELSVMVDEAVNGWLDAHPEADNIRISHAASPSASFPTAFVILTYECGVESITVEEVPGAEVSAPEAEQDVSEPTRRRGRPPTKK